MANILKFMDPLKKIVKQNKAIFKLKGAYQFKIFLF